MAIPRSKYNPNEPIPNNPFYSPASWKVESDQGYLEVGEGLNVEAASGNLVVDITPGEIGSVYRVDTANGVAGGPITGEGVITLAPSGVQPGSYIHPTLEVDIYGRITAAAESNEATTTEAGIVRLATLFEVIGSTNNTHAVTPAGLQAIKSDSVTFASSTRVATSAAVKVAYDVAASALVTASDAVQCASFTQNGDILAGTGAGSFVALPAGADGQTLKACSACTGGVTWDTDETGPDIPCATITAVGDLIAGTGVGTFTALAAGTNGYALLSCSTCPEGLFWSDITIPSATPLTEGKVFACTPTTGTTTLGYAALAQNTTGTWNTAIGTDSLLANLGGSRNVGLGATSLRFNVSGDDNVALGYSALLNNATGSRNVAVGGYSQYSTTGSNNVGVGYCTLQGNTSGNFNIAVGSCALYQNTAGEGNIALGFETLRNNTSSYSTAVGHCALQVSTAGTRNSAFGSFSSLTNTSGVDNTSVGYDSLRTNSSGSCNTSVGSCSLRTASGSNNTAIGFGSGCSLSTGTNNTFLGHLSGAGVSTGSNNVILGTPPVLTDTSCNIVIGVAGTAVRLRVNENGAYSFDGSNYGAAGDTLQSNGPGSPPTWVTGGAGGSATPITEGTVFGCTSNLVTETTALGATAAASLTTGVLNVAIGNLALSCETTGGANVAVGHGAMSTSVGASANVAVGTAALCTNNQGCNVAIGGNSLRSNNSGFLNTAVGYASLRCNTSGQYNTAIGACALFSSLLSCNTAVGYYSGYSTTTGCLNTSLGMCTLRFNTTGYENTAVGHDALWNNIYASFNTAVGVGTLAGNVGSPVSPGCSGFNTAVGHKAHYFGPGLVNTAIGACALVSIDGGESNVGVGFLALASTNANSFNVAVGSTALCSTVGNCNTAIGDKAGCNLSAGANNIMLGYQSGADAMCNALSANNLVVIGNDATQTIVQKVASTVSSDIRIKKVSGAVPLALHFVESLNPIKYQICDPETGEVTDDNFHYGFSAQNVIENEEDPENPVIGGNSNPDRYTVNYSEVIPVLVNAIKELSAEVKYLKSQLER